MKKFGKFLAIVMVALCTTFVGCKKSNEALIKEYSELCSEILDATKDGDAAKLSSLENKAKSLAKEMDSREFTDEEQAQIAHITAEISSAMFSASGAGNLMKSMSEKSNSTEEESESEEPSQDDEE